MGESSSMFYVVLIIELSNILQSVRMSSGTSTTKQWLIVLAV